MLVQRQDVTGREIEMAGSKLCFSRPTDKALVVVSCCRDNIEESHFFLDHWTDCILYFCPRYFRQHSGLVHHPLQAGRVVRLLRLVRLIRLVKFYQKNTSSPKYKKGEDGAEALGVAGQSSWMEAGFAKWLLSLWGRLYIEILSITCKKTRACA